MSVCLLKISHNRNNSSGNIGGTVDLAEMIIDNILICLRHKINVGKVQESSKDRLFWSQISTEVVKKVLGNYKWDFEMFGFSPKDYFKQLKLNEFSQLCKEK